MPSVERWRAQAQDPEWFEDDDGLGWEGAQEDDTAPTGPAPWNGNGQSTPSRNGNGNGHTGDVNGGEWTRRTEGPAEPVAPAFAAAASATDLASARRQPAELGRTVALDDDDWAPPVGREWGVAENAPATAVIPPAAKRRRKPRTAKLHPVVLVAIYAAVGIGLVVLASTALLGGSDPAPAAQKTEPTPEATASASPVASATPDAAARQAAADAAAASAAAERQASNDFTRERAGATRKHAAALAAARADARREAKARARAKARKEAAKRRAAELRAAERRRSASPSPSTGQSGGGAPPPPTPTPYSTTPTNPTPRYVPPAPKRRSGCEFCIG